VCQLGVQLDQLVSQQQLQLAGQRLLLAPPWLQVTPVQQQVSEPHIVLQESQQAGLLRYCPAISSTAVVWGVTTQGLTHDSGHHRHCLENGTKCMQEGQAQQQQQHHQQWALQQGASAALCALMAVWHGARNVYACLPSRHGPYTAAFQAVVQLNESSVVCERIRQRELQSGEPRQLQMLQWVAPVCRQEGAASN